MCTHIYTHVYAYAYGYAYTYTCVPEREEGRNSARKLTVCCAAFVFQLTRKQILKESAL